MKKVAILLLLGISFITSCSGESTLVLEEATPPIEIKGFSNNNKNRIPVGVENVVKRARQMTDILYTPCNPIEYNKGIYQPGVTYKGLIYSSVKETETYVGECVSFHTFITAVNNPRSKLYTEKTDQYPYHGVNCKAYYGTVCSGLVSYALGLIPRYASYDFPESELMDLVDYSCLENLQIADILWREGHVALITDIIVDESNIVSAIEISESPSHNCRRYVVSREQFINTTMTQNFNKVYRYRNIAIGQSYPFIFDEEDDVSGNMDICVDKGDRSCYLEGEDVIINILSEWNGGSLEIYKDGLLFKDYPQIQNEDIVLDNLSYGDYMARLVFTNNMGITTPQMDEHNTRGVDLTSNETYWKVVNTGVNFDKNNYILYFNSSNAKPIYAICCKENGSRPHLKSGFCYVFTEDEIKRGFIEVNRERLSEIYPFMKLFFETDYGMIINKPIKWCE